MYIVKPTYLITRETDTLNVEWGIYP